MWGNVFAFLAALPAALPIAGSAGVGGGAGGVRGADVAVIAYLGIFQSPCCI
jgi:hypothetical protein